MWGAPGKGAVMKGGWLISNVLSQPVCGFSFEGDPGFNLKRRGSGSNWDTDADQGNMHREMSGVGILPALPNHVGCI